MKKVYVVLGSTGEYSDHVEWPVRAFLDEDKAKDWVEKCSAYAREHHLSHENHYNHYTNYTTRHEAEQGNPYDSNMRSDYTGTNYYYWPIDLEG